MATNEEIDLSGNTPSVPDKEQYDNENVKESIKESIVHIGGAEGLSDAEFLKKVLATPAEELLKWEECELPSKGIYYGWTDSKIHVKPMNQVAEKILATPRLAQSGQSIDYLFEECCRFPSGFRAVDLLVGDRTFILYYLRGITYGNMYEFAMKCNNETCGKTGTYAYDLNVLASTIVFANQSVREPYEIVLPYLSEVYKREFRVGVRFLRGYDVNDILAKKKFSNSVRPGNAKTSPFQRQEHITLDDSINQNMEKIIVTVMGIQDPLAVRDLIPKLHAKDTAVIREWLKDYTPGIDGTIEVTCKDCGTTFKAGIPITDSFFRATKQRGM